MNNREAEKLMEKYLNGNCTEKERAIFESWYNESIDNRDDLAGEPDYMLLEERLKKQLSFKTKRPSILKLGWSIAASILLLASLGLYFFVYNNKPITKSSFSQTIKPGSNKAYLTLANGRQIVLDGNETAEIVEEEGLRISKAADGQLIYEILKPSDRSGSAELNENTYNKINTPRGGQYEVHLPDGTKVWLNAESSIKFSTALATMGERKIELVGEAYFEVAKDKKRPFKVKATSGSGAEQEVEVLGTHFNISSYSNEPMIETTLLEGAVRATRLGNSAGSSLVKKSALLIPGEQLRLSDHAFNVKKVDVDDVVAWKTGYFIFENDNLDGILKKIARWYDVDISYDGHLNSYKVVGAVSRTSSITEVLQILEQTDKFKFKLEGRRVIVMP